MTSRNLPRSLPEAEAEKSLSGYQFTFLHGSRVRSGSNYIGKIMGCNPNVQLIPPGKTTDELPLLNNIEAWERAFTDFQNKFKGDRSLYEFRGFLRYLGAAWQRYLIDRFDLKPGPVFLKSSNVKHIDRFFDMFPDAKLILLFRDGRDNVASTVKAGLAERQHHSFRQKLKPRLSHLVLRDFASAARDWSKSVNKILRFDEQHRTSELASRYLILRYEDVYKEPGPMAERIFAFMEAPCDRDILMAVEGADVVGSSFYGKSGKEDAVKPNWTPTKKTEAFQPVGRWKAWNAIKKNMFKRIAGNDLVRMGYEKDLNW
jgi:Sulfotransferase family